MSFGFLYLALHKTDRKRSRIISSACLHNTRVQSPFQPLKSSQKHKHKQYKQVALVVFVIKKNQF